MTTITVLIPAHNASRQIARTVVSVRTQTRPADRILVAADNCSDDTDLVRTPVTPMATVTAGSQPRQRSLTIHLPRRCEEVMRFWSHVEIGSEDECWTWAGTTRSGYGRFYANERLGIVSAHRYSLSLFLQTELPDRKLVLHSCDNRSCVNPRHLRLGTHQENSDDCVSRGRYVKGKTYYGLDHALGKLSSDDVADIRWASANGVKRARLAERYGVTGPHISNIVNWKRGGRSVGC